MGASTREITLDAAMVAPRLGLSPQRFMALWRRGLVHQRVEQGLGEDAGQFRISLRYLATRAVFVVDAEGRILLSF